MMTTALLLAAYAGMVGHWYKKYFREQTASGLLTYMKEHPKNTIGAVCSVTGAVLGLIATGVILSEQTIALAFGIGFTLDSTVNKAPEEK